MRKVYSLYHWLFLSLRQREEGREESRERSIDQLPLAHPQLGTWPATQVCAPTGNPTGDLSVHRQRSVHGATPARAVPLALEEFN